VSEGTLVAVILAKNGEKGVDGDERVRETPYILKNLNWVGGICSDHLYFGVAGDDALFPVHVF